jgi:hypothetical protein
MTWSLIWIDTWSGCPDATRERNVTPDAEPAGTHAAARRQHAETLTGSSTETPRLFPALPSPPHQPELDQPTISAAHAELLRIAQAGLHAGDGFGD